MQGPPGPSTGPRVSVGQASAAGQAHPLPAAEMGGVGGRVDGSSRPTQARPGRKRRGTALTGRAPGTSRRPRLRRGAAGARPAANRCIIGGCQASSPRRHRWGHPRRIPRGSRVRSPRPGPRLRIVPGRESAGHGAGRVGQRPGCARRVKQAPWTDSAGLKP